MVFALRHDVTRIALEAPQNKEHLEQARIVLKNLDYLAGKMKKLKFFNMNIIENNE